MVRRFPNSVSICSFVLGSSPKITAVAFLVVAIVITIGLAWHPKERTVASAANRDMTVSIIQCRDYGCLFFDMDNTRYRFELRDRRGLISATSYWGDSYNAQNAIVRWNDSGHCDCLLDGEVTASLVGYDWQPTAHP